MGVACRIVWRAVSLDFDNPNPPITPYKRNPKKGLGPFKNVLLQVGEDFNWRNYFVDGRELTTKCLPA